MRDRGGPFPATASKTHGPPAWTLAGLLAAGGSGLFSWLDGLLNLPQTVRGWNLPLGAIPIGLALVLAFVYFVRATQARASKARRVLEPLFPFHELPLSEEERAKVADEVANESGQVRIWRRDSISTISEHYVPKKPSLVPPPPTSFVRNLLVAFSVLVVAMMMYRRPFFATFDAIVHWVGTAIFWPRPYVTLLSTLAPGATLPDYIFLVYFAFLIAFLLASGVLSTGRFDAGRRSRALGIVAAYPLVAVLSDVLFFTIGEPFSHSAALLTRGILGGIFVSALVLTTFRLPEIVTVRPLFEKEPGVVLVFFLAVGASVIVGLVILYTVFRYVGLGQVFIPIGVILLLPLVSLTVWALIGRAVYYRHLASRPPPPLGVFHPLVSVIIPAYNEAEGIAETIRSVDLAARLYPGRTEILVGNDGSTDRTLPIAIRAVLDLEHASGAVVDLPHGGKANVLNALVRLARGEVLIRIDADMRLSSTLGFASVVPHLADPDIGGVQGLILPRQEDGWTRRLRWTEISWNHLFMRPATMGFRACQVVDGAFSAFRRQDILDAGGWVEWNGEDTEITIRLQRQGFRMRYETGAAGFEDVPENYAALERQRVRWNRGGVYARYRHFYPSLADPWGYGGLATIYWLALFIRSGLRSGLYLYVVLVALFVPTIVHLAFILVLLMLPRGIVIGYYFLKYHRGRLLGWIFAYPIFSIVKQHFAVKSWGTMFPGEAEEYV